MSINLLLDTTRDVLMLALAKDGEIITRYHDTHPSHRYHSAILLPKIQEILQHADLMVQDLEGIAVNCGPGSFTGIRTGLTVARLLGQFSGLTTYGFNTFELLAGHPVWRDQWITLLLNAFRQQHYQAALRVSPTSDISWRIEPRVETNASPITLQTERCLIDASLVGHLIISPNSCETLSAETLFTPEVMAFYLHHHSERFRQPWADLRPMYLQLPNITLSKSR